MQQASPRLDPEIAAIIRQTIEESMMQFGLRDVRIRAGEDQDGDPVILIDADYTLSEDPTDTEITTPLTTNLRDRLWERGELRFPHISHHFDECRKVKALRRRSALSSRPGSWQRLERENRGRLI